MAAAYFFASPVDVEVKLEGEDLRKSVDMKMEKEKTISCPVYYDGESVSGQVLCRVAISVEEYESELRICVRLSYV
jgi:vacuolar protein sorting-associated protein 26